MSLPSGDAAMWNERFAARPDCYGTAPNSWLARNATLIRPGGEVLCLAEGQGRNALWLAGRGFRVRAVDLSAVALGQLRERAAALGLEITTVEADLATWMGPVAACDAVVLIFAHFPPALRRRVHQLAAAALRPGGIVIHEAFQKRQLGFASGGPRDVALLQSAEELREDFAALTMLSLSETEGTLDEGPLHQGRAELVHLVARR